MLPRRTVPQDVLNISSVVTDGAAAIVDDSFLRCFTSTSPDPWNWNFYLFPAWLVGVVLRYCVLFPLRLALLFVALLLFLTSFFAVRTFLPDSPMRHKMERRLIAWMCSMFVASWTGQALCVLLALLLCPYGCNHSRRFTACPAVYLR